MSGRKKRTRASAAAIKKRFRRIRETCGEVAFTITTAHEDVQMGVQMVSGDGVEEMHIQIHFDPPLSREDAVDSYIDCLHVPTKQAAGQLVLLPYSDEKSLRRLEPVQRQFLVFPSHATELSWPDGMLITQIYLLLQNTQMRGDNPTPVWQLYLSPPVHDRYEPLPYFPPVALDMPMDATMYPQRLPLSFKPKTGITSSRVPKLLGYYPGKDEMTNWKRVAIRNGRLKETEAVFTYLHHFPKRTFSETGYHETKDGASQPDGLVHDPEQKKVGSDGLIEIKCSTKSCLLEGPHFAQAIWEMMTTQRPWIDVMRYCVRQVFRSETKKWETQRVFRVVRLFREPKKEEQLLAALKDPSLAEEMRVQLDKMALDANTTHSEEQTVDDAVVKLLQTHREQYFEQHKRQVEVVDPALDRMDKRQAVIFELFQDKSRVGELHTQVAEQIQDLVEIIKK